MEFQILLQSQNHNRLSWCQLHLGGLDGEHENDRWIYLRNRSTPHNHYSFKFKEDYDYFILLWGRE